MGVLIAVMWFTSDAQLITVDSREITVVNCRGCSANGDYCGPKIGLQWSTAGTGMVLEITVTSATLKSRILEMQMETTVTCIKTHS